MGAASPWTRWRSLAWEPVDGEEDRARVGGAGVVGRADHSGAAAGRDRADQPGASARRPSTRRCKTVLTATSRDARAENHRIHEYLTRGHPQRRLHRRVRRGAESDDLAHRHGGTRTTTTSWPRNQVTVVDGEHRRRFDIVLYVNGLPLGVRRAEEGRRRQRRPEVRARTS